MLTHCENSFWMIYKNIFILFKIYLRYYFCKLHFNLTMNTFSLLLNQNKEAGEPVACQHKDQTEKVTMYPNWK